MFETVTMVVLAYLVGSLPSGYWTCKLLKGVDIRQVGSGSTGATNVLRCAGKGAALFVLLADVAKGYIPVVAVTLMESKLAGLPAGMLEWHVLPPLVALAALIGHSKSIFLGFQGGKSAATGLGTLLGLNPAVAALTFAYWLAILGITRIVSVASIIAVTSTGLSMYLLHNPLSYVAFCIVATVHVILRHKSNIERLLKGQEPRLGEKRSKQVTAEDAQQSQCPRDNM